MPKYYQKATLIFPKKILVSPRNICYYKLKLQRIAKSSWIRRTLIWLLFYVLNQISTERSGHGKSVSNTVMKFVIQDEIFEKLPQLYVGVVVAKGVDNKPQAEIEDMLAKYVSQAQADFKDVNVKESPAIIPYRDAFRELGINPNRFPCSAEAMYKRLSKGKDLPNINPLVNLNNAVSLKYGIPMGTHKLDGMQNDIVMRFSEDGDSFIPLGKTEVEAPDAGEVVYASGHEVRTRRWTWRQSELGKIDDQTRDVFFPLDGFKGINDDKVDQAAADLVQQLKDIFGVEAVSGHVDRQQKEFSWE